MISEILFPEGVPENLKAWAIVLPDALRTELIQMQDALGAARNRANPVPLTDGRWMLCADILEEARPGGLLPEIGWITPEQVAQCVVMPWSEALALLPPPPEDEDFGPLGEEGGA